MQLRGANAASLVSLVPKASAFLRIPGGALSLAAPNTKPAYVPWDGLYIESALIQSVSTAAEAVSTAPCTATGGEHSTTVSAPASTLTH